MNSELRSVKPRKRVFTRSNLEARLTEISSELSKRSFKNPAGANSFYIFFLRQPNFTDLWEERLAQKRERELFWARITSCQTLFNFVTMSTRTVWSKEPQTHRPLLSGLQSMLEIGCVDNVTFCRRLTEPATPISLPSESFFERWAG